MGYHKVLNRKVAPCYAKFKYMIISFLVLFYYLLCATSAPLRLKFTLLSHPVILIVNGQIQAKGHLTFYSKFSAKVTSWKYHGTKCAERKGSPPVGFIQIGKAIWPEHLFQNFHSGSFLRQKFYLTRRARSQNKYSGKDPNWKSSRFHPMTSTA